MDKVGPSPMGENLLECPTALAVDRFPVPCCLANEESGGDGMRRSKGEVRCSGRVRCFTSPRSWWIKINDDGDLAPRKVSSRPCEPSRYMGHYINIFFSWVVGYLCSGVCMCFFFFLFICNTIFLAFRLIKEKWEHYSKREKMRTVAVW